MNILYFLVGCSLLMALIFLFAFFWALKSGQHDDVYTPGVRILFDDEVLEDDKALHAKKSENNHFSE
jgi:cbb3-type cytochrome oxidase maturation protein